MTRATHSGIGHPLLAEVGVPHGFAVGEPRPPGVLLPRQVHGADVTGIRLGALERTEADAILASAQPGRGGPVGVVTADCVPILAASVDGRVVAAVHAGWRGLAAGVVEVGISALLARACEGSSSEAGATAVVGPHIGPCCYEVDAVVVGPLEARFGRSLVATATTPSRPGHWRLDLGLLALADLERSGVANDRCASLSSACTACDPRGFESYRRDGPKAGRMLHYIATTSTSESTFG